MAFNRFTLIWFPTKYQKLWNRQWYTVLLLLLPFLNICWRFHEPITFVYLTETSARLTYWDANISSLQYILTAIIYLGLTFLAGIFNIGVFIKFTFWRPLLVPSI